jgi:hypothetical protein
MYPAGQSVSPDIIAGRELIVRPDKPCVQCTHRMIFDSKLGIHAVHLKSDKPIADGAHLQHLWQVPVKQCHKWRNASSPQAGQQLPVKPQALRVHW